MTRLRSGDLEARLREAEGALANSLENARALESRLTALTAEHLQTKIRVKSALVWLEADTISHQMARVNAVEALRG